MIFLCDEIINFYAIFAKKEKSKSYDIFTMILDIKYSTKDELLINSGIEQKGMTLNHDFGYFLPILSKKREEEKKNA